MKKWQSSTLVLLAPAALGAAAGWWGGLTGADSTVAAAVLPAVLTGGGGALLGLKMRRANNEWEVEFLLASAGVIVLALTLVAALHGALWYKEAGYERKRELRRLIEQRELVSHIDFRRETLQRCAREEKQMNAERARNGEAPLPPNTLCDPALLDLGPPLR